MASIGYQQLGDLQSDQLVFIIYGINSSIVSILKEIFTVHRKHILFINHGIFR